MAELAKEYKKSNTFLKRWGAVFILLAFFIGSWGGQFISQLQVVRQESEQHGQEFQMDEFWPEFWAATFENWQSEWLQLFTQALLISGLSAYVFRKQDEEHFKTQMMIEDLQKQIKKRK